MPGSPAGRHHPVNSPWPRRLAWMAVGLFGATLVLAGLVFANRDWLARRMLISALEHQTGTGVRLDGVELGARDASLRLQNLVISNPPGFTARPLLALPELYLAYNPEAASSNALRFREIRLHLAELSLEVDRSGRTNLMSLAASARSQRGGTEVTNLLGGLNFQGIDRLTLTLGRIHFRDERDPRRNRTFDLGITNRSLLNVRTLTQLMPLAMEIAFKGGMTTTPGSTAVP